MSKKLEFLSLFKPISIVFFMLATVQLFKMLAVL